MPVIPTYPSVYIEELPSGVRTIAGVAAILIMKKSCSKPSDIGIVRTSE